MGRILGILGSFVACSSLLWWGVNATYGAAALERGEKLYYYRAIFDRLFNPEAPRPERSRLLWLGDSTIIQISQKSYPQLLRPRVAETLGADTLVVADFGFDPYSYYFVTGRLLEAADPTVVAIVAHLIGFNPKKNHPEFRYNDLSSYLLPAQLPRTFLLPLGERQLSPARVVIAQALGLPGSEAVFYTAEGLRLLYEQSPAWAALGPRQLEFVYDPREWDTLRNYQTALAPTHSAVQMLEATVRTVTESGRVALVVVSPIPLEAMRMRPWYDEAAVERSVGVLRSVVENAGGMVADLHRLLPQDEFKDFGGHYKPLGATHTSEAVWPFVRDAFRRAQERRS